MCQNTLKDTLILANNNKINKLVIFLNNKGHITCWGEMRHLDKQIFYSNHIK